MTVGILGGGQLAVMLAQAASPLNLDIIIYDPDADSCAKRNDCQQLSFAYDDWTALEDFASHCDIITYEFENIPLETLKFLAKFTSVEPSIDSLHTTQDRLREKRHLNSLAIKTANFLTVDNSTDLKNAADKLGYPFILKSRFGGYDGKGQWRLQNTNDLEKLSTDIELKGLIAEEFIHFDRELSIIALRNSKGQCHFYELSENSHQSGILHYSQKLIDAPEQALAESYILKLMNSFDYCGAITLELFQKGDELIANEYSPRVHNSGHWTIEGSPMSQFEGHLRAISNLPLNKEKDLSSYLMLNFISTIPDSIVNPIQSEISFHHYKKSPKQGRKLGHLTVKLKANDTIQEKVAEIEKAYRTQNIG